MSQARTVSRLASTRPSSGSGEAVLMLGDQTRLLRWNRTAAILLGIPADSVRGLRLEDFPRYAQLVPGEVRAALLSPSQEMTWPDESTQSASLADIGCLEFSVVRLGGDLGDEAETLLLIRDGAPIHPAKGEDTPEPLGDPIAICAHCKNLSNGQGAWQSIETYVAEHSGTSCRQEMCPACVRTLYPELCDESPQPSPTAETV